eukprot:11384351-Alexandrium_andersonii.AAC.1
MRNLEHLQSCVAEELDWVAGLSSGFWERLSTVAGAGTSPQALRSGCLRCACRAHAYLDWKLFSIA